VSAGRLFLLLEWIRVHVQALPYLCGASSRLVLLCFTMLPAPVGGRRGPWLHRRGRQQV